MYRISTYIAEISVRNVAAADFFAVSNVTNTPFIATRFDRRSSCTLSPPPLMPRRLEYRLPMTTTTSSAIPTTAPLPKGLHGVCPTLLLGWWKRS